MVPLASGDPVMLNFSDQGGPKTLFKAAERGPDLLHLLQRAKGIHPRCCCPFQVRFGLQFGQQDEIIYLLVFIYASE